MAVEIHIPPILKIGGGSFAEASTLLLLLQCKRPLIVTDPFLMKSQLAERLRAQIQDAGLSCEIFHETVLGAVLAEVDALVADNDLGVEEEPAMGAEAARGAEIDVIAEVHRIPFTWTSGRSIVVSYK